MNTVPNRPIHLGVANLRSLIAELISDLSSFFSQIPPYWLKLFFAVSFALIAFFTTLELSKKMGMSAFSDLFIYAGAASIIFLLSAIHERRKSA